MPLTYRELAERAKAYANGLTDLGVRPGDRVAILLYNSIEYWLAYFGVTRLGAVAVQTELPAHGCGARIRNPPNSSSSLLLADGDLLEPLGSSRERLPSLTCVVREGDLGWAHPWSQLENGDSGEPETASRCRTRSRC